MSKIVSISFAALLGVGVLLGGEWNASAASSPDSLQATVMAIDSETDQGRRSEALDRAVQSISAEDRRAALDILAQFSGAAAGDLEELLIGNWTEDDPAAAAAWAGSLPEGRERRTALKQVATSWAENDSPAAARWLRSLPESESRQSAVLDAAYETARTDPPGAIDLVTPLPAGRDRDALVVHAMSQWVAIQPAAAITWARQVTDLELRQQLLGAAAVAQADQNGFDAATLATTELPEGGVQDRAIISVIQRWAEHSPTAAAGWVAEFPDVPLRTVALQNLISVWVPQDRAAAKNWLDQLPDGSLRENGLSFYNSLLSENPELLLSADGR